MSKIAKLFTVRERERRALMQRISVTEHYDPKAALNYDGGTVYTVAATLSARVISTEDDMRSGGHAIKVAHAKKLILAELFGEFVKPLLEAEQHARNYESNEAAEIIRAVLNCFYSDEEFAA